MLFHSHPLAASDLFRRLNKLKQARTLWSHIEEADDGVDPRVGQGLQWKSCLGKT